MNLTSQSNRDVRGVNNALLASIAFTLMIGAAAFAEERKFLVILANSPKQYPGGLPAGGLQNPETIRKAYFDKTDPNIRSFAEYWEEISYGDVRISELSRVTDWINLPWAVTRDGAAVFVELQTPGIPRYNYGRSESFDTSRPMRDVDLNGDGLPDRNANYPFTQGGRDRVRGGTAAVWMPGERFVDMNGDGLWNGLDESRNQMDFFNNDTRTPGSDGRPDLLGPWIDLNGNGVPDNTSNCVYLPDSDNDGNPDCCPNGPGRGGCAGIVEPDGCLPTTWETGRFNFADCNGNLVPDFCDVGCGTAECLQSGWLLDNPGRCGTSNDRLPVSAEENSCTAENQDGVPDECQFENFSGNCVAQEPDENSPCANTAVCITRPEVLLDRCEFHDADNDGDLDIVEPFENFVRLKTGSIASETYIRNNYPGDPDKVIDQRDSRTVHGQHDPFGKVVPSQCRCANGSLCSTINSLPASCPAGTHADYNPPDFWIDIDSTQYLEGSSEFTTPEPDWYRQAWVDRYGTIPPPWGHASSLALPVSPGRFCFNADFGGLNGNGTAWIGCSANDRGVDFVTPNECNIFGVSFPFTTQCNNRILPEELNGIGVRAIYFDGHVEFDDLPSSKYHRAGDQHLGEITSPYSNAIWGEDRGNHTPGRSDPDDVIPAAGPYATRVHGNFGLDAGNVLAMELLTRRTTGDFPNNDSAWARLYGPHPYGGFVGFRDFNVDGLIDQGESRPTGNENYTTDVIGERDGNSTDYPWNRRRLLEDCIAILDDVVDFDDFVDTPTMRHVRCGGGMSDDVPLPLQGADASDAVVAAAGVLSGIVLLPSNAHSDGDFNRAPNFYPIHNEDGLGAVNNPFEEMNRPSTPRFPAIDISPRVWRPQVSWNLFFHDLVRSINVPTQAGAFPIGGFQAAFTAHEYGHTWEHFPDLYDYDVYEASPAAIENCPVGVWDIMANGGLVHPVPILKEKFCTNWVVPVNLTSAVTPGVDRTITLPPAEFVRDSSYYFLENPDRPGERYYLWSAGLGFDEQFPSDGLLILHTDVGANPDALPPLQRTGTRPGYAIVQADGLGELEACTTGGNRGDDGDPWPGSTNATRFNFNTTPAATWYTQDTWSGLDVLNIEPDGAGSIKLTLNWVPTNIPSLSFVDPPGGETVGGVYQIRTQVTDVYGGTTLRFFRLPDTRRCSATASACTRDSDCAPNIRTQGGMTVRNLCVHDLNTATAIGSPVNKTTPGTHALSHNWTPTGLNGRFAVVSKLIPGPGADGDEVSYTAPQKGRNNVGNGAFSVLSVSLNDTATLAGQSRLETWTATLVNASTREWTVHSSITQPVLNATDPASDPYPKARSGQTYPPASYALPVSFRITEGSIPFQVGDSFTFTTTGVTAVSQPVTVTNGLITLDPVAVIVAAPLSGDPPLQVFFDGRESRDPNGETLQFLWDFGDGSTSTINQPEHIFADAGTYTVVLRVTNPNNGRFGESAVDIEVINNAPIARVTATPTSGRAPLDVQFSAAGTSDRETLPDALIYQWDFGDGSSANDAAIPGLGFQSRSHTYGVLTTGTATGTNDTTMTCSVSTPCCTAERPCKFVTTLTVIDAGGKRDTETVTIRVGNTNPTPVIRATSPLNGPAPLTVSFNAKGSFDLDGDTLLVEWLWGDGSPSVTYPITGPPGSTTGDVEHQYALRTGETTSEFQMRAVVRDNRGGEASFGPVTISVTSINLPPVASFIVEPLTGVAGMTVFTFDGSGSSDPDGRTENLTYRWNFGDGSALAAGVTTSHTYAEANADGFTVTLTVTDERGATASMTQKVVVVEPTVNLAPVARIATGPRRGTTPAVLTFDGRPSYDENGDDLTYTWRFRQKLDGLLLETLTGSVVNRLFPTVGTFTVELTVSDGELSSTAGPEDIIISPPPAPPEPPPDQDVDGDDDGPPPDSADQRPPSFCGLGMLGAMFAAFAGLTLMRLARRRG